MALDKCHRRLFVVLPVVLIFLLAAAGGEAVAQQVNIMSVGSLRSWFSNMGCEIEEGRVAVQQDGLEWPAYYLYQDCEAAKGFWIGTTDFTDQNSQHFDFKVVHIGPRVNGQGEFYPTRFEMISKLDPPQVTVDGNPTSSGKPFTIDRIDPSLPYDRILINEDNTSIGLHMTRKIIAFQQGYHDNYFIYDYVFTNTGNANADPTIELPNKTLTGVYFFWQYRYSPCAESRGVGIDHTSWGFNTMNDSRGDGLNPATTFFPGNLDNDLRIQYAWHGRDAFFTQYDGLGASVWNPPPAPPVGAPFSDRSDTSGRLCDPQWVGIETLHVDRSAIDHTDDPNQPSTTSYQSSDDNLNQNKPNSQFDIGTMTAQYAWMTLGHESPRHADKVGKGTLPNADPSLGTSGGYSVANGYGPYTIAPGDSVHIVLAEAVAGLSREVAISVGKKFKDGNKYAPPLPDGISAAAKDDSVYTVRDSLVQTFRRAQANYQSGFQLPEAPYPPKSFTVTSLGDGISLAWDIYAGGPTITGWRLYRAIGRYDGSYVKVHVGDLPSTTLSFFDTAVVRGADIYYYLLAVGDPADNTGGSMTTAGVALTSNRIFSQTYDPAQLRRKPGATMSGIRIVPNPFSTGAYSNDNDPYSLRFPGAKDRIAFFNIPARCKIRIYTEMGELVNTIEHTNGTGDEFWNSVTSSNQVIVSGVYIVVFENSDTGEKSIQKLIIIR